MTGGMDDLLKRLKRATGADRMLDQRIARLLEPDSTNRPIHRYTASVDSCIALIERVLPDWAWHVGYGPRGILPYAAIHKSEARFESTAPTVPLALLAAMVRAKLSEDTKQALH